MKKKIQKKNKELQFLLNFNLSFLIKQFSLSDENYKCIHTVSSKVIQINKQCKKYF
jgi:hypothetical protein